MFYFMSLHTIEGLKFPLRSMLKYVLTKFCDGLGISDYMLPRLIHTNEEDPEITRRRREEVRRRQRQRRRYAFDHRTAEERMKELLPRGVAPRFSSLRVLFLGIALWFSLVVLVYGFGCSAFCTLLST